MNAWINLSALPPSPILASAALKRLLAGLSIIAGLMLGAALISQYGFDLHPCELCLLQRWPYVGIILLGAAGALVRTSPKLRFGVSLLCVALFFTTAGIGAYHAGVEAGVFKGLDACSSGTGGDMTLEEMRAAILNAPLVSCGQSPFYFLGLSMAGWNALMAGSVGIAALLTIIHIRRVGMREVA